MSIGLRTANDVMVGTSVGELVLLVVGNRLPLFSESPVQNVVAPLL